MREFEPMPMDLQPCRASLKTHMDLDSDIACGRRRRSGWIGIGRVEIAAVPGGLTLPANSVPPKGRSRPPRHLGNIMTAFGSASRRDFLKDCLAGAAALSADPSLMALAQQAAPATKSRVVVAHDSQLRGTGSTVDPLRIQALLDLAIQTLFDSDNHLAAWRRLVKSEEHT